MPLNELIRFGFPTQCLSVNYVRVCVRACVRACVHACAFVCVCVRVCVRACVRVRARARTHSVCGGDAFMTSQTVKLPSLTVLLFATYRRFSMFYFFIVIVCFV